MLPIAHTGDWIESIIFGVPLIGFLAWLAVTYIRDRRRARAEDAADPPLP